MRQFLCITAAMATLATLGSAVAGPAAAQGLFSPIITVNDKAITRYELDQRTQFLTLLNAPGDVAALAREQLIEDRIKLDAAEINGVEVPEEAVAAGMEEFAGRANYSAEEFIAAIGGAGVAAETYRDFVRSGVAWREVVRTRFGPRVNITEQDVEMALANSKAGGTAVRVLLSEIVMNAAPAQRDAAQARAQEFGGIRSADTFSAQARKFSTAPTRDKGGRLEWQPISELPAALQPIILALQPGQVSAPVQIDANTVAVYQLRDIERTPVAPGQYASIEYAAYYIPGGQTQAAQTEAANIRARVDRCDDLYGIAKGQPAETLERVTRKPSEIPADIARELDKLDSGEVSTALTRNNGQVLVFLMMCKRTTALAATASTQAVTLGLQNRRLEGLANGYLRQLRSEARIEG